MSSPGDDGTTTATGDTVGNGGPDPDCARLAGDPTDFDVSGTPFVFAFDYVDAWTPSDPLVGSGGRVLDGLVLEFDPFAVASNGGDLVDGQLSIDFYDPSPIGRSILNTVPPDGREGTLDRSRIEH